MTTPLAAALFALELGHLEPRAEDVSGMCPPSTEALEQTTTAIWSDLFATLQNTSLERDIEEMGWGLVNLFHRAATKKHATIDRLTDEIRLLLAEQDGSQINTSNLKDKIDLARKIEEAATCHEHMRDTAAAHYIRETGRSWMPSTGNRISLGVASAAFAPRGFAAGGYRPPHGAAGPAQSVQAVAHCWRFPLNRAASRSARRASGGWVPF